MKQPLFVLYLLVHTLIFVIESIIGTLTGCSSEEISHIILVEIQVAGICTGVLVVLVKFAAFTACFVLVTILGKVHKILFL